MASRNQFPKWSPDGKYIAFVVGSIGPRRDLDQRSRRAHAEEDHRSRQREGAPLWTPDSKALLYTAADKKLYSYSVADGKTGVVPRATSAASARCRSRPTASGSPFSKQDRTLRSHVYIAPIAGGEERHVSDDSVLYSESNAVWTADGRYLVFTSAEGFSNGIATQGGINTTMALWALSLRDQDRDPTNRDIDNEAQGLAAEAAAQNTGPAAAAGAGAAGRAHRLERHGAARAAAHRAGQRRSAA